MSNLECPYCLTPQTFHRGDKCEAEGCGKKVPRQYIELARTKPPIWIVTYGPSQHGKSTLLGSGTFLMERLGIIVPRAFHTYLDEFTSDRIAEIQKGQHKGQGNIGATLLHDTPEPLIIVLKNFPKPKETQLFVIFDLAGEVVDKIVNRVSEDGSRAPVYARAVTKAKTVWFIVSLNDLQKDMIATGTSINRLFFTYTQAMEHLNVPIRDRDILVTYTKADELMSKGAGEEEGLTMPPLIEEYLRDDPYSETGNRKADRPPALDVDDYITQLERVSEELRFFTQDEVTGGSAFVAMAEDSEVNLYFTINSAQGGPSEAGGAMGTEIRRFRVLDPILWTITLSQGSSAAAGTALILPTHGSGKSYSMGLPLALHDALRLYNVHATTYFAGEVREAFGMGMAPVEIVPPERRLALIGPILDRLPRESIVVVLSDEALPLDIDDFADTAWDERLLLFGTDIRVMNARIRWKYQVQSTREVEQITRDFLRQVIP